MVSLFMATYIGTANRSLTKDKKYPVYKAELHQNSGDYYFLIVDNKDEFVTIAAYYFKLETKLDEVLK